MKYIILIFWLICWLLSAGLLNKSFNDDYHWSTKEKCLEWAHNEQSVSIMIGLGGPFTLIAVLGVTGFGYKGWSLALNKCEGY